MTHEVFVNYRTGDSEKIAALIWQALAQRFGKERIFRASASIAPGERYPERLLDAVRRSHVVLTVIGEGWSGRAELSTADDWVRKEILTAYECGIEMIPILDGRKTEQLRAADLPPELAWLADLQFIRLDLHDLDAGLTRLGNLLADKVPALKEADTRRKSSTGPAETGGGSVRNSIDEAHGQAVQSRDFTGNVFRDVHGIVHTGSGDNNYTYNPQSFNASGPGAMNIAGDNHGGIRQNFGTPQRDEEDDR